MKTTNGIYIGVFRVGGEMTVEAEGDSALAVYPINPENALKLAQQLIEKSLEVQKLERIEQEKHEDKDGQEENNER